MGMPCEMTLDIPLTASTNKIGREAKDGAQWKKVPTPIAPSPIKPTCKLSTIFEAFRPVIVTKLLVTSDATQ